jgi:hypothetical protein
VRPGPAERKGQHVEIHGQRGSFPAEAFGSDQSYKERDHGYPRRVTLGSFTVERSIVRTSLAFSAALAIPMPEVVFAPISVACDAPPHSGSSSPSCATA